MQQEQSAPQEGSTPEDGKIPSHRTETTPRRGAHRASAKAPNTATPTPGAEPLPVPPDETLVLPTFITGKKGKEAEPEAPPERSAPGSPDGALPASERGMLVFVAALLGIGTIAVVVLLGLGGFSAPSTNPATAATMSEEPTPASSPSPSPSPAPPSPSPSPSPSHSATPARTTLGTLTAGDPRAFCGANEAGRARQHEDRTWYCSGSDKPPLPFSSTDVCRWRYQDKTAYAVAVDINDPATWKCYT